MSRRRRRPATSVTPPTQDVRRIIREELTKALALPAGAQTTEVTAGYLQALQQRGNPRMSGAAALTRDPRNNVSFGPGDPLFPAPLDPPLPSGRPAPRRWEYPVSWNLQTTTTRLVPWTVLRDAADKVSVMRACIEVCKTAITGLEWSFTIDSARARNLAKRAGTSTHAVTSDLQDRYADDMDRLHVWWQKPDRVNNLTFSEWLTALLEDELVVDAVALWPHLAFGGDLYALELVDGTTIKPLLDYRGATPQPPLVAYQQILQGFPRGEFSQPTQQEVNYEFVSAVYGHPEGVEARTDALIYKVRNRRSFSPYGFSCVEQALTDVDLWLKRWDWLRSEYTAGVTPEMIVQVDAAMTPEQMREWEAIFNDDLSGRSDERHRARFLPAGFNPSYPGALDAKFSSDLDLHLIRLICAAFDVLPSLLGFTPNHGMGGMGGQGHQQAEMDTTLQRATKPRAQWVIDLVNEVSHHYLGMPQEVTFTFHGLDPEDEKKEAELLTTYVQAGLIPLNEGRDQLNRPRYDFEEANQPMVVTPTGPTWLNVDVQPTSLPGNLPAAQQQQRDEQVQAVPDDAAKKAEQKAFLGFVTKRAKAGNWRDFQFNAHPPEVAEAANRLAAAGDVDAVRALFAFHDDA